MRRTIIIISILICSFLLPIHSSIKGDEIDNTPLLPSLTGESNNTLNPSIKTSPQGGEPLSNYSTTPDLNVTLVAAATHSSTPDMAFGDIDSDGHDDLVLCVNGGQNRIFKGNGNGSFILIHLFSDSTKTIRTALLDVDKDGDLDIVFANMGTVGGSGSKNVIHMNENGSFNNSAALYLDDTDNSVEVAVADFNADGWIDIIFGNHEHNKIHLNRNGSFNSTADWSEPKVIYNGTQSEYHVATDAIKIADVNTDGILDYVTGNIRPTTAFSPTGFYVWLGNGNGTYGTWHQQYSKYYFSWTNTQNIVSADIELVDIDGDSDLDLIASTINNNTQTPLEHHIYIQDQTTPELFDKTSSWSSLIPKCGAGMDVADVDADGAIDILFAHWPCTTEANLTTDGYVASNGTWPPSRTPVWSAQGIGWSFDSEFIDIDEDGDLDAVVLGSDWEDSTTGRGDSRLFIHLNPRMNQDKDEYEDHEDDCPTEWGHSVHDRIACPDSDGDGWSDADASWTWGLGADRFPNNADQHSDSDGDGWGDNSTGSEGDDCPNDWGNSTQGGILGCSDSDGDNWADTIDWSSSDKSQWKDSDGDSFGDNPNGTDGDDCPEEWGNSTQGGVLGCTDSDNDGWADTIDWLIPDSSQWADVDADGYGDNSSGTDGDDCPGEWGNSTENGILGCTDFDGDGWADTIDWSMNDSSQWIDDDGDGWGDSPTGTDGDDCPNELGNSTENGTLGCIDIDGDGWANIIDSHENESTQWLDGDNDGYGDNPDGLDADDCPLQFGESFTDLLGCADWDNDGVSNGNDPDPLNASLTVDPDADNVDSSVDNCPDNSNPDQADYDGDGDGDACDDDGDGDTITDLLDSCPMGNTDWISIPNLDVDRDGCKDLTEDSDDDGDGILDGLDLCTSTPDTYTGWISSTDISNSSNSTDWDGDGCEDFTTEDLDDDNDGVVDVIDVCPNSPFGWISTETTDADSNGCEDISQDTDGDGTTDKYDQCPNTSNNTTADDRGCSVIQNQQSGQSSVGDDPQSFSEKLMSGDLDAVGLILAATGPIGVTLTIMFQRRKRAHFRGLRKRISSAETESELLDMKPVLVKSISEEHITQGQYNILLEAIEDNITRFSRQEETAEKGEKARSKTKEKWNETFSTKTDDKSSSIDEDGIEWWEDENEQWWYRNPGEEEWGKWED